MTWSICIFAYNEERHLPVCIAALEKANKNKKACEIHIVENGSSDETVKVAEVLAAADPRITLHQLPIADKTNAWNTYIHDIAPKSRFHFFIDGDVTPCAQAFDYLEEAFSAEPNAYAVAALPAAGRSQSKWSRRTLIERHINGNLYALSSEAIAEFRKRNIRMPIGSVGEDGLLRYILATNFEGGSDDSHNYRIAVSENAWFDFESLQVNPDDISLYRKRLQRYSKRHFQNKILYPLLKKNGIAAMPEYINEIYSTESVKGLWPRLSFENFFGDIQTLQNLRKISSNNEKP